MRLVTFETIRGRKISVNPEHVINITGAKEHTNIYLNGDDDDEMYSVVGSFDDVRARLTGKDKREIIAISSSLAPETDHSYMCGFVVALCNDGSVWRGDSFDLGWTRLADIPQEGVHD